MSSEPTNAGVWSQITSTASKAWADHPVACSVTAVAVPVVSYIAAKRWSAPPRQILSPFRCRCGQVQGGICTHDGTRIICHCKDCRRFANTLAAESKEADNVVNDNGGVDLYIGFKRDFVLVKGAELLRRVKLSKDAPITRTYCSQCHTPVISAYTWPGYPQMSVHVKCLQYANGDVPPIGARIHGKSATSRSADLDPPLHDTVPPGMLVQLIYRALIKGMLFGYAHPEPYQFVHDECVVWEAPGDEK